MHNMLEHEDEIKSRPAKSWFQTEREKRDAKKRSAESETDGGDGDEVRTPLAGRSLMEGTMGMGCEQTQISRTIPGE